MDIVNNGITKNEMVFAVHIDRLKHGRWTSRVTTWRPYYIIKQQENTSQENSQTMERRHGHKMVGHDLAEDSTRQANMKVA